MKNEKCISSRRDEISIKPTTPAFGHQWNLRFLSPFRSTKLKQAWLCIRSYVESLKGGELNVGRNVGRMLIIALLLAIMLPAVAQNPDEICGIYYNVDPFSKEGSQVEFYKVGKDKYCAKVVWVENPEKVKFLGLVCFYDVTYNADDKEYKCGKVVYPGKNGTFKGYMSVQPDKNLKVRGYWGVSLFGKTLIWKRETKLRKQER